MLRSTHPETNNHHRGAFAHCAQGRQECWSCLLRENKHLFCWSKWEYNRRTSFGPLDHPREKHTSLLRKMRVQQHRKRAITGLSLSLYLSLLLLILAFLNDASKLNCFAITKHTLKTSHFGVHLRCHSDRIRQIHSLGILVTVSGLVWISNQILQVGFNMNIHPMSAWSCDDSSGASIPL